jgi:hypothetical protein
MNDPVIDEVRRVRLAISDQIGPDLTNMVDYFAKAEGRFKRPPISPPVRTPRVVAPTTNTSSPSTSAAS